MIFPRKICGNVGIFLVYLTKIMLYNKILRSAPSFPADICDLVTVSAAAVAIIVHIKFKEALAMTAAVRKKRRALVDETNCVACGCCVKVCPLSAIQVRKGVAARVDGAKCVGCGKCVKECPASVIALQEVTE